MMLDTPDEGRTVQVADGRGGHRTMILKRSVFADVDGNPGGFVVVLS